MRSISDKTQGPPFRLNSKHIVYHGEKFPFKAVSRCQSQRSDARGRRDRSIAFKPASQQGKSVNAMLDQVIAWGGALKPLREKRA